MDKATSGPGSLGLEFTQKHVAEHRQATLRSCAAQSHLDWYVRIIDGDMAVRPERAKTSLLPIALGFMAHRAEEGGA